MKKSELLQAMLDEFKGGERWGRGLAEFDEDVRIGEMEKKISSACKLCIIGAYYAVTDPDIVLANARDYQFLHTIIRKAYDRGVYH